MSAPKPILPPWLVKTSLALIAAGGVKLAYDYYASRRQAVAGTANEAAGEQDLSSIDIDADPFAAGVLFAKKKLQMSKLSIADKLALYAFYKQATEGSCNIPQAPSLSDMAARAKYDAWMKCKGMPRDIAKQKYLEQLESLSPGWRERIKRAKEAGALAEEEDDKAAEAGSTNKGGENSTGMGFSHTSRPTTYLMADSAAEEDKGADDEVVPADEDDDDGEAEKGDDEEGAGAVEQAAATTSASGFTRAFLNSLSDLIIDGDEAGVRAVLQKERDREEQAIASQPVQSPMASGIRARGRGRNQLANHSLNSAGERPLHLAVDAGHPQLVRLLVEYGADPTLTEKEAGSTALHYAVSLERFDELEIILRSTLEEKAKSQAEAQSDAASSVSAVTISPRAWARHLLFELEDDDGNSVWDLAKAQTEPQAKQAIERVCGEVFKAGELVFP